MKTKQWLALAIWLLAVGVVSAFLIPAAFASQAPSPWAGAAIILQYDGTGHGTPAQTFITSANGFSPADDSPTDGVVSSQDQVGYGVQLQFQASLARVVAVTVEAPSHLRWEIANDQLCRNGHLVTATRSGNTCQFTIPRGAVESINAPLVMTALDTAGEVIRDQRVTVTVGLSGQAVHNRAVSAPVTVVSAPAVDVILTQPSFSYLNQAGNLSGGAALTWNQEPHTGGHFLATPVPLRHPGSANQKGASHTGYWFGYFDVSEFAYALGGYPVEWRVGGVLATPSSDGLLAITPVSGNVRLDFALPQGWPTQQIGETRDFRVRVRVNEASFANSRDLLNNGTGWQPGDGYHATQSTFDAERGAIAGRPFPNNDFAVARVNRPPLPPPGEAFAKTVLGPLDPARSIWETENIIVGATEGTRQLGTSGNLAGRVAPGTQLTSLLQLSLSAIENPAPDAWMIMADVWDAEQKQFDLDRAPIMFSYSGAPAHHYLQWSEKQLSETEIFDITSQSGWIDGQPGITAQTVRIFAPLAELGDANGIAEARIPLTINQDWNLLADGTSIPNTMYAKVTNSSTGSFQQLRNVVISLPPLPGTQIAKSITHVSSSPVPVNSPEITAAVGDQVAFRVVPSVLGFSDTSAPITQPEVTVYLDRCLNTPRNTSTWIMRIYPAIPAANGRVCGEAEATPTRMVFSAPSLPVSWSHPMLGNGTLAPITFSAQVSTAAPTTLATSARFDLAHQPPVIGASSHTTLNTTFREHGAAAIWAQQAVTDVAQPLIWSSEIVHFHGTYGGGATDTIIALPRGGANLGSTGGSDSHFFVQTAAADPDYSATYDIGGYDGARLSAFHGTYYLAQVGFDTENSTARASLFFTTRPLESLLATEPATPTHGWYPVTGADPTQLVSASGLRVVMAGGDTVSRATLNLVLHPAGNLPGDVYVMWMGPTANTNPSIPLPWPAPVAVVAAEVSGYVWWDNNLNGIIDNFEEPIPGVRAELVKDQQVQRFAYTDERGFYSFRDIPSGDYQVRIMRGDAILDYLTTFYQQTIPITNTYSFANQFAPLADDFSTRIHVGLGEQIRQVNFGYAAPDPKVSLDKSPAVVECTTTICNLNWDIALTNLGNATLEQLSLFDEMPGEVFGVSAVGRVPFIDLGFVTAAASVDHSLALTADGALFAWGNNANGRLGDGTTISRSTPVLVAATWEGRRITQLSAGRGYSLALMDDGTVWAWGEGSNFRLGDGNAVGRDRHYAAPVAARWGTRQITQIAAGSGHSVALADDGSVWAWGDSIAIGDGWGQHRNAPVQVTATWGQQRIVQVASGFYHSLALADDGTVWAWGSGATGRLGDGSNQHRNFPVQVAANWGQRQITQIAAGNAHSLALADDGTLWAWGFAGNGQLGDGNNTIEYQPTPVQVIVAWGDESVVQISAGRSSKALTADGTVWAWGFNQEGQLGDGTTAVDRTVPIRVTPSWGSAAISWITSGADHTLTLTHNGQLWGWGRNQHAQLGDGGASSQLVEPRQPGVVRQNTTPVVGVAAGEAHSIIVTRDGQAWAWGNGAQGRLGTGGTESQATAVPVTAAWGANQVAQVSSGITHNLALLADGRVYAWGNNQHGRLGDGTTTLRETPEQCNLAGESGR